MSIAVIERLLDRNPDTFPPSERHLAAGHHFARLLKRTRGHSVRWKLDRDLAGLLDIDAAHAKPDKYGLEMLADHQAVEEGINKYLESHGIAVDEVDSYVATEVVIDIRQALVNGEEGTIPLANSVR